MDTFDGFSQTIIYLQCLNNNRALGVLELFCTGVQSFGLPVRIRCDHGMENPDLPGICWREGG